MRPADQQGVEDDDRAGPLPALDALSAVTDPAEQWADRAGGAADQHAERQADQPDPSR
ncbi:MAG TPA: hypothetical protein VFA45_06620 [Actinomycetes bacterium]|nr:hypothetical protein [Actinomycetes bacterium]